jgi:hypothetical protein
MSAKPSKQFGRSTATVRLAPSRELFEAVNAMIASNVK